MARNVTLIGFGEAGETFASAASWQATARAFDTNRSRQEAMKRAGVITSSDAHEALDGCDIALSLVTADQALAAAENAATSLEPGTIWCDMNSVAPRTKQAAAQKVVAAGGRYVDVAIMAPVNPQKLSVPLLLSGADASGACVVLEALGFTDVTVVGDKVGRASTIKMLRSVVYKGMEALTAECLLACERAGVTEEVLRSFGSDWATGAEYRLDRMLVHGERRAAELREVCKTLEDLGMPSRMSAGTIEWQQVLGNLALCPTPDGLGAKLAVMSAMPPLAQKSTR